MAYPEEYDVRAMAQDSPRRDRTSEIYSEVAAHLNEVIDTSQSEADRLGKEIEILTTDRNRILTNNRQYRAALSALEEVREAR